MLTKEHIRKALDTCTLYNRLQFAVHSAQERLQSYIHCHERELVNYKKDFFPCTQHSGCIDSYNAGQGRGNRLATKNQNDPS